MSLTSLTFADAGFAYPDASGEGLGEPVVSGLTFELRPGEVTLLCGASGCGKSTALKMANGLIPHYVKGGLYGEVSMDGTPLGQMPLHEVSRRVGSVFQNPRTQLFNAEVRAELAFACENAGTDPDDIRRRIERVAHEFACEPLLNRTIFELSGGERQKVACMCVSVLDPDVVVLDEPSSNLDARAVDDLRSFIASWKRAGKAVLVAEHRLYYLRDLVDQAIYLERGHPTREWSGTQLRALTDRDTDELGLRAIHPERRRPHGCGDDAGEDMARNEPHALGHPDSQSTPNDPIPVARICNLTCDYGPRRARMQALNVERLELPVGMPIALVGHNGAGKSTLLRTLAGLSRHASGTCTLPGGTPLDAQARLARSYLVMQDVTCQLFCPSVREEAALGQPDSGTPAARQRLDAVLAELNLEAYADTHPLALSGGQQQRVSIAAALTCEKDIVLFDEPTSGLDLGHMRHVADLIERIAADGRLVLVISHDYEFVCACCHHAVQLEAGRVVASYGLDDEAGAEHLHTFFWGSPGGSAPDHTPPTRKGSHE